MDDEGKKAPADRDAEIIKGLMKEMDEPHRRVVIELTRMLVRLRKTEQRETNRRHTERVLARRWND